MKINTKLIAGTFVFVLAIFVALSACKKTSHQSGDDDEDLENSDVGKVHFKGWGRYTTDLPEGAPLSLAPGLEFVEAIHYHEGSSEGKCDVQDPKLASHVGEGGAVKLCVTFRNTTSKPLRLELPPGLIFLSVSDQVQDGVLLRRLSVEVPANQYYFCDLGMYCVNGSRAGSGDRPGDPTQWNPGPVTNVKPVLELIEFIKNKDLDKFKLLGASVQVAISDIGGDGKISEETWVNLRNLPNK